MGQGEARARERPAKSGTGSAARYWAELWMVTDESFLQTGGCYEKDMRPDAVLFCIRDGGAVIYSGNDFYHPVYRGLLSAGI